ncbi:unnamed protein product [Adineta steineri]|uniref:Cyclic nucleotide-binding domain-containing protein n=1 Tax=Adineta steineri TaxID=433720 RepID=A0A818GPP2_9BILA|nr:unnamed protein product [Adineta steineri]CAF0826867.1 unnamed protein product [Adineta steineri]CAF1637918.1 unnamed protein product [Adineta steineri]CAF3495272.1 unnamed protein product [Adineta steineri]
MNDVFDFSTVVTTRRGAISSTTSIESNELIPIIEKDSRTIEILSSAVKNNILFSHLDDIERKQIFDVMFPGFYSSDEVIIRQNERGEHFYIIEEGEVDVYINDELMTSFGECSCFGELALIQSTPRTVTIKAKTNVKLWSLFGETYRKILMDITIKKRNSYREFLNKVSILQTLDEFERLVVADSLESIQYEDGDIIVRQGDPGDDFFIIVEGTCTVHQKPSESSESIEIDTLSAGDYFGEIALLCNRARVATIIAKGSLKCVKMNRKRFERILGPIRDILQRNIPQYNSIIPLDQLQTMIISSDPKNKEEY